MTMTLRMQLQVVALQRHLFRRAPRRSAAPQMPAVERAAGRFDERRWRREEDLERRFQTIDCRGSQRPNARSAVLRRAGIERQRGAEGRPGSVRPECVWIEPLHERVGCREFGQRIGADEWLEMNDLVRGEQILLVEREVRIGNHEVRADDAAAAEKLRQEQDGERHGPYARAPRDDEQIEVALGFEIHVRDAARQRHEPRERNCRDETERETVPLQKRAAPRLAPPPFGDESGPARRKEESVAPVDDLLEGVAAFVQREDLRRREVRLDQRLVQLIERDRVIEQPRVDDRARDGELVPRHTGSPAVAAIDRAPRVASASTQPHVRNTSVPSVAHAAPSIDIDGSSRAFSTMLMTSATPQIAA